MMNLSKSSVVAARDGQVIPVFGLGLFQDVKKGEVYEAVLAAIRDGYRKLDTSPLYRNEEDIGAAIKKSGIARHNIYITTKVWNDDHGSEGTIKALNDSLAKLGVDYVDCYLIHSVMGGETAETWETMVELKKQGLARSIGVANFSVENLQKLKEVCPDHIPAVNQVEVNMYCHRKPLMEYCQQEGILVEASFPLARGHRMARNEMMERAQRYMKSPAQMMIRWCLQKGYMCVPKTTRLEKIKEYGDVFDFQLTEGDIAVLGEYNCGRFVQWDASKAAWNGVVEIDRDYF